MKSEKNFSTAIRIFCHKDTKTQSFTKILCPDVFQMQRILLFRVQTGMFRIKAGFFLLKKGVRGIFR